MSMTTSMSSVHLIVTCTRRKTLPAGETVFPDEDDAGKAYGTWLERLTKAGSASHPVTAGGLYTGQHWNRAAAAAARAGAELWIISAGLGFLHTSDRVVPYDATFASMPCCHRTMWERLTARPPTQRRCPSLTALMRDRPHDRFIVAASPAYLQAVEDDLYAGREALASPAQLTIVSSKGYRGRLRESLTLTSAAMMKTLNTNMTGLNISQAVTLLAP